MGRQGTVRYIASRRSRIFLKRGPLSCEVPSRRDSVGGGSSRNFPWSPTADVIQWRGGGSSRHFPWSPTAEADVIQWGGGVVAEIFRGLRQPLLFSGGGVVAEIFRRGGPGSPKGR